jgi:hypothetical protein
MSTLDKKRPVIFAGENHLISLYLPGEDDAVLRVSCWRCTYSAQGEGFVLAWACDGAIPGFPTLPKRAVYSDNTAMARLVMGQLNEHFAGFAGVAALEPQPARFIQMGDGQRMHRITCLCAGQSIELLWQDVFDAALEIFDNRSGPVPYDVSAVICPCRYGSVALDGVALNAEIRVPDGYSASSAFLAFSETWVARPD